MVDREKIADGNYTHVLWDWDGCLAKTLHLWVKHYTKTFQDEGIKKTRAEIVASMGIFRKNIQLWGYSLEEANRLVSLTHGRAAPELKEVGLYPRAVETVRRLGEMGIRQAIVTKSPRHIIEAATKHHKIDHFFDAIVGGDDVAEHHQKPHRFPVDAALRQLGGEDVRAVIIGDSHTDLLTAKNAEIDSVLYYPKENKEFYRLKELKKYRPTFVVRHLPDVPLLVA